jgi:hypothetical protein
MSGRLCCPGGSNPLLWHPLTENHGESPPVLPEEYWRSLGVGQSKECDVARISQDVAVFRKRVAFACKNRGWAEMGQLLQRFFDMHKDKLNREDLLQLDRILLGAPRLPTLLAAILAPKRLLITAVQLTTSSSWPSSAAKSPHRSSFRAASSICSSPSRCTGTPPPPRRRRPSDGGCIRGT